MSLMLGFDHAAVFHNYTLHSALYVSQTHAKQQTDRNTLPVSVNSWILATLVLTRTWTESLCTQTQPHQVCRVGVDRRPTVTPTSVTPTPISVTAVWTIILNECTTKYFCGTG